MHLSVCQAVSRGNTDMHAHQATPCAQSPHPAVRLRIPCPGLRRHPQRESCCGSCKRLRGEGGGWVQVLSARNLMLSPARAVFRFLYKAACWGVSDGWVVAGWLAGWLSLAHYAGVPQITPDHAPTIPPNPQPHRTNQPHLVLPPFWHYSLRNSSLISCISLFCTAYVLSSRNSVNSGSTWGVQECIGWQCGFGGVAGRASSAMHVGRTAGGARLLGDGGRSTAQQGQLLCCQKAPRQAPPQSPPARRSTLCHPTPMLPTHLGAEWVGVAHVLVVQRQDPAAAGAGRRGGGSGVEQLSTRLGQATKPFPWPLLRAHYHSPTRQPLPLPRSLFHGHPLHVHLAPAGIQRIDVGLPHTPPAHGWSTAGESSGSWVLAGGCAQPPCTSCSTHGGAGGEAGGSWPGLERVLPPLPPASYCCIQHYNKRTHNASNTLTY